MQINIEDIEEENSALANTMDTDKTPKGNENDTATPESTVYVNKDSVFLKQLSFII
jgi:hypothetical protein